MLTNSITAESFFPTGIAGLVGATSSSGALLQSRRIAGVRSGLRQATEKSADKPSDLSTSEPAWLKALNYRAAQISTLNPGWDGPGSIGISRKVLFLATSHVRFVLNELPRASAPQLVPGGDGSLQIEWHEKHGELELDIGTDGRMSIWIRDHRHGAEFDAENEEALALFYRWAPWIASEQYHVLHVPVATETSIIAVAA